jgi:hypothetical protein
MNNDTTTKSPARIEFLTDVLITAVEGGIGYWSQCTNYSWSAEDPTERGVTLYIEADQVDEGDYRLPIGHGIVESWGEDLPVYVVRVTLDDIASGLGFVTRGESGVASDYVGRIFAASVENDCGEMDALDADVVIQSAIFGKVIFG